VPQLISYEGFLLPKNRTIKTYWSMEVILSAFLTRALDGLSFSTKSE
jgi:hypothetical protein